jgi:hypothetical protein
MKKLTVGVWQVLEFLSAFEAFGASYFVAQISNLLYRRLPVGWPYESTRIHTHQ